MRPSSRLITLWVIVILLVLFITISAKQLDEGLAWLTPVSALVVAIAVGVSLLDWLVSKRSLNLNINRTMPLPVANICIRSVFCMSFVLAVNVVHAALADAEMLHGNGVVTDACRHQAAGVPTF